MASTSINSLAVEGDITIKNKNIDRDGSNPSTDQYGQNVYLFRDKDGERIGYVEVIRKTDGSIGLKMTTVNELQNGTVVYGGFAVYIDKSGKVQYDIDGTIKKVGQPVWYIQSWDKGNAALLVDKEYGQNIWSPIIALRTYGGGGWAVGNFNDEVLQFVYATQANIESATNTTTRIYFTETGGAAFPGNVNLKSGNINRDAANPSDNRWGNTLNFTDVDGETIGQVQPVRYTDGQEGTRIIVHNEKSNGDLVENVLNIRAAKDGTLSYSMSDPPAFRNALGASSGIWPVSLGGSGQSATSQVGGTSATDIAKVISAASGITIVNAYYAKWGRVVQLYISWQRSTDVSVPASGNISNVTVGTLASELRPKMTTFGHSNGDDAGAAWYTIGNAAGNIVLGACESTGAARTIAAGSTFRFGATYII